MCIVQLITFLIFIDLFIHVFILHFTNTRFGSTFFRFDSQSGANRTGSFASDPSLTHRGNHRCPNGHALCLHLGSRVLQPGAVLLQPLMDVDARGQQSGQVLQRRGWRDLRGSLLQSDQNAERRPAARFHEARPHLQERAVTAGGRQGQQSIQLSHDWPAELGEGERREAKTRHDNFNNRRSNLSVR